MRGSAREGEIEFAGRRLRRDWAWALLKTIPNMVLGTLSPRRFKRLFGFLALCLGLTPICAFAQPVFFAVDSTPYDRQMERVRPVFTSVVLQPTYGIPLDLVNQWMTALRDIPYQYSRQWQMPEEINAARRADCKGKALLLYEIMRANGATNLRFVIGRHHAHDWFTHAWLEWETEEGTYLLDPTFYRAAIKDLRSETAYIPLFGYESENKYRAFDVALFTQN